MIFEHLHQSVLTWANERGLLAYGSPCAQYLKTSEELGELAAAMARHDPEKIADALGDVLVTLIILAHLLDCDPVTCLAGAYDEIKDRRGLLRDGVFIKAEETRDAAGLPLGVAA
jgi:uncharacterized protein YabN with tetrapyrrole methylase and pyrophosphatase domain